MKYLDRDDIAEVSSVRVAASTQAAAHFDAEEMKLRKLSGEKCLTTEEVLELLKSLKQ